MKQKIILDGGNRYNTRARPQVITQKLDPGVQLDGLQDIEIYRVRVGKSSTVSVKSYYNISISGNVSSGYVITYTAKCDSVKACSYTLLGVNDYLDIRVKVTAMESNMYLGTIASNVSLDSLTNVNYKKVQSYQVDSESYRSGIMKYSNYGNFKIFGEYRYSSDPIYTFTKTVVPPAQNNANKHITDVAYIKYKELVIAGKVFVDKNSDGQYGSGDELKSGSTVKLYRGNSLVATATTNSSGMYTFERQPRANSGGSYYQYYVEFEYDGLYYKSTENYSKDSNISNTWRQGLSGLPGATSGSMAYLEDSNAYEFTQTRIAFNNKYKTIGYNASYTGPNAISNPSIKYQKSGTTSTLLEDKTRIMTARSFVYDAKSTSGYNPLYLYGYEGYYNPNPETEYLKFINLGLQIREKVDLDISTGITNVKNTVNGEETNHTFDYKQKTGYNLEIYKSDYNYRYDTNYDNVAVQNHKNGETFEPGELNKRGKTELTTEVTYRITVTNQRLGSIPVLAAVNEVALYYDSKYMTPSGYGVASINNLQQTVMVKNGETGIYNPKTEQAIKVGNGARERTDGSKYGYNGTGNKGNGVSTIDGYSVLFVTVGNAYGDVYIAEGESMYFDITFTISKDGNRKSRIIDAPFNIIAEINAFSTKYASNYVINNLAQVGNSLANQVAGKVDVDSNPGSAFVESAAEYEDDTSKTDITFKLMGDGTTKPPGDTTSSGNARALSGYVWEDMRTKTVEGQTIGNGIRNTDEPDKDIMIQNVTVTLMEVVQTGDNSYYEVPAKNSANQILTMKTNSSGYYYFEDFVPGYYIVRFDYGDTPETKKYNGQDYKSTTYYNSDYYGTGWRSGDYVASPQNNNYYGRVKTELEKVNLSDAQDDEIRRLEVNAWSETMTTAQMQIFAEPNGAFEQELIDNTKMNAECTIFYVTPEKGIYSGGSIAASTTKDNRLWRLDNLDFGIEYRPEVAIKLDKDISTLELITSDGNTLIKLYFEPDGSGSRKINTTKSIGADNVQYIPNTEKEMKGIVYINMDTDILEGCTMNIEYEITATNNSEIDRISTRLNDIKYEMNTADAQYLISPTINPDLTGERNYSANQTAAKRLKDTYYNKDVAGNFASWKVLRKSCTAVDYSKYYGQYVGVMYYTGNPGNQDMIVDLKVDNVIDYIDNDLTFDGAINATDNKTWSAKTSQELATVLNWSTAGVAQTTAEVASGTGTKDEYCNIYFDKDNHKFTVYTDTISVDTNTITDSAKINEIIDTRRKIAYGEITDLNGVKFVTDTRKNIVMSVDTGKKQYLDTGNASLSTFLRSTNNTTGTTSTTGTINLIASKVLSGTDITEGTALEYDNLAEITQYTTLTGRKPKLEPAENVSGLIATGIPEHEGGSIRPDPPIPPEHEGGSIRPDPKPPRVPPEEEHEGGSIRPDPSIPVPDEVYEGGSVRTDPPVTNSGDFTETITITPPTGLIPGKE